MQIFKILLLFSIATCTYANPLRDLANALDEFKAQLNNVAPLSTAQKSIDRTNSGTSSNQTPQVKVVESEGVGETLQTSKEDAIRNAIQKTVGSYVTSDLISQNDQIIKDKVINLSSAFVDKVDVISQGKHEDGLFSTKIKATVKTLQLKRALEVENIKTVDLDSESLFGEALTKLDNSNSKVALWENLIKKSAESAYVGTLVGKPQIDALSGDDVLVTFKAKVDWEPSFKSELISILNTTTQVKRVDYNQCNGIYINAFNHKCGVIDKTGLQSTYKTLLQYSLPLKLDINLRDRNGEIGKKVSHCFGDRSPQIYSVNPFISIHNTVQIFLDDQAISIGTMKAKLNTQLNRFGKSTSDANWYSRMTVADKKDVAFIELSEKSGFIVSLSIVAKKEELLKYIKADVVTGACSSQ